MSEQITLYIRPDGALPDNREWTNRFEINSETGDDVYTIAQHKTKRHWACSCPRWRNAKSGRSCKHLAALALPGGETPYEPKIERS